MYYFESDKFIPTIDFINGFLTSQAHFRSALNRNLAFVYYFKKYPKQGQSAKSVVENKIRESLDLFIKENPSWTHIIDKTEFSLKNAFDFYFQQENYTCMKELLKFWIIDTSIDVKDGTFMPDNFMAEKFIALLNNFFTIDPYELFTIQGNILNELYYFWGGVMYQDLFFETMENVFHLHFHGID